MIVQNLQAERLSLRDVKRRKFVKNIVKFLPWIGAGTLIFPALRLINSQNEGSGVTKISLSSLSYDVNSVKNFFIIKEKGGFRALSRSCTHLGCELKFDPLSKKFICPCHKSEFDLEGKVLKGPALKNLSKARIKIKNNEMEISL